MGDELYYPVMQKKIKYTVQPFLNSMGNLKVHQPMPSGRINHLDPFILLHHLGPQKMSAGNDGLPFEPHPHKGFETVTIVLEGDVVHEDSAGFKDTIRAGGVQWMTAGKGILHKEDNSDTFKKKGGTLHALQLWLNLPKELKGVDPNYQGIQGDEIPEISLDGTHIRIIAGTLNHSEGPAETLTDVEMYMIHMESGADWKTSLPPERNVLLYQLVGNTKVNGEEGIGRCQYIFQNEGSDIEIEAKEDSILLLASGTPFRENIVAQGPFVMNSKSEILEAMEEYREGKLGVWNKD